MEYKSSDVKYSWPDALETSQKEPVIIKKYKTPYSVLISCKEYKKLTTSVVHQDSVEIKKEMERQLSSTWNNRELNGEKFRIKFSHQAENLLGLDIPDKQLKKFLDTLCDSNSLDKSSNVQPYKLKINGLMAIYTFSGVDVFVLYAEKL